VTAQENLNGELLVPYRSPQQYFTERRREWVRAKTIQATVSPELPAVFTGKKNATVK